MRRIVTLLLALPLAACSSGTPAATPATSAAGPKAGTRCAELASPGRPVAFQTPAGTQLAGVEFGTGPTGIVLAHQNASNLCEWLPFGKRLADRGYRVLAFDFAGDGDSGARHPDDRLDDDVAAAAAYLRTTGAAKVVLIGASKGGAAVLAAAPAVNPAPAAVVTLSAPKLFSGVSAADAVPRLPAPALFLAAENDHPFAEAAKEFDATAPAAVPHQVFLALGAEHGTGLLGGGQAKKVAELIETFVGQHTGQSAPPQ